MKQGCDKYDYIKYLSTKQRQSSEMFFYYYAVDFISLFTAEWAFRISNVTYYRVAKHLSTCDGEEYKKFVLQLLPRMSGAIDPHSNIGNE